MKTYLWLTSLMLVGLAFACYVLVDTVPPRVLTETTMHILKRRILRYAHANGDLPRSLAGLPEIPQRTNSTVDAWGGEISYEVNQKAGIVTLKSQPPENEPAIIRSFRVKTRDGQWANELTDWLPDVKNHP